MDKRELICKIMQYRGGISALKQVAEGVQKNIEMLEMQKGLLEKEMENLKTAE